MKDLDGCRPFTAEAFESLEREILTGGRRGDKTWSLPRGATIHFRESPRIVTFSTPQGTNNWLKQALLRGDPASPGAGHGPIQT